MTKTSLHISLLLCLALAILLLKCSSQSVAGGTSETTNSLVATVYHKDGSAASNTAAKLRPADYLPQPVSNAQQLTASMNDTVTDSDGDLADPATSMKITITDNRNGQEVTDEDMTKDSTGQYHYDWNTEASTLLGTYYITYKAVDGSRVSIAKDSVEIV